MLLNCRVGEDSWESLELQGDPISPSKGNQSWIIIGRTDVKAETTILWPPYAKNWLFLKDWCWEDWRREEKGPRKDKMVGWHHQFNEREFEWTPNVGDGQEGLVYCSPWGLRVRHDWVTELTWAELCHLMLKHSHPYFLLLKWWSLCYAHSKGTVI